MVKVTRIDTPKPKQTKLYWGTLLLSWVPFVGLGLSLNGVIRSVLGVIKSIKAKKLDKRAFAGTILSSFALIISVLAINSVLNPTPSITLNNAETNTDNASYTLTGTISNIENDSNQLTINGINVPLNNDEFSHKVDLEEGDNIFNLVATNENGETKKVTIIHRTTQAEFAARAEAERLAAEKIAEEERNDQENSEMETKPQNQAQQKEKDSVGVNFYINNAYFKSDNAYDIVVYSSDRETLKIYVNDKSSTTADVNEEGWATFKKVKLTGVSKLSFAKKVGWFEYSPVDYVRYISADNENVTISNSGPKYHFDEFYDWATTVLEFEVGDFSSSNYRRYSEFRWKNINNECDYRGAYSDGEKAIFWDKTCLSDKYKDYIKSSSFNYGTSVENSSFCPASDAEHYSWICSRFGDMLVHIKSSQQATEDTVRNEEKEKARIIYNEISLKDMRG